MLSGRICQMLTAYVDGEFTERQARAVRRLLRESAEARDFLHALQQDAGALRRLPRHQLPQDFAVQILDDLVHQPAYPRRPSRHVESPASAWGVLAAAAAVLVAIGLSSYVYFARVNDVGTKGPGTMPGIQARRPAGEAVPGPLTHTSRSAVPAVSPSAAPNPDQSPAPAARKADSTTDPVVPGEHPRKTADMPVVTDISRPKPRIEEFQPRIPLSLVLREMDQEKTRQQLRAELRKDSAFRLELFCVENVRGLERLRDAFAGAGFRFLLEPEAQARLKNRTAKTDFALYSEDLTANELVQLFEQLGVEDKKAEAAKRGAGQFGNVIFSPLLPTDRDELSRLLGMEPAANQAAKPTAPLGVDIRKPIAEQTVEQVIQNLKGEGRPRPAPGKPATVQGSDRSVLVWAYSPGRPRGVTSRETRLFLERNKERRPGTVQLFLLLHSVAR